MISVIRPGFASKNVSKKSGFKVFGVFVFMFRAYLNALLLFFLSLIIPDGRWPMVTGLSRL
jgi:hypothetical protein